MSSHDTRLTNLEALVRAKDGWYRYLFDYGLDLGVQWAKDAGFLQRDFDYDTGNPEDSTIHLLRALQTEARHICLHDELIQLPTSHLDNIPERILSDARDAFVYLRNSKYGISPAELKEGIGIFYADIIPETLQTALHSQLNLLATKQVKIEPECNSKVVLDPSSSLYSNPVPFQSEVFVAREDDPRTLKYSSHFAYVPTVFEVSSDGSKTRAQSYINGLGPRSRHSELYALIEQTLALTLPLFDKTVGFPVKYGSLKRETLSPSARRWKERAELRRDSPYVFKYRWNALLKKQERQKASDEMRLVRDRRTREVKAQRERENFASTALGASPPTYSFSGSKVHMVTKAVTHIVGPGELYEDQWHTEGLPHDRIVACAVYCYDADSSLEDVSLSFRRLRREYYDFPYKGENYQDEFWFRLTDGDESNGEDPEDYDCPSDWEEDWTPNRLPFTIPLGSIHLRREAKVTPGRIVSFPNWVQHKVSAKNTMKSGLAQLKLFYVFLVEDSQLYRNRRQDHVEVTQGFTYEVRSRMGVTTSNIHYSMRDCNLPTLHFLLPIVSKRLIGRRLPPEIVEAIITALDAQGSERGSGLGMSWQEVERRRQGWIKDMGIKMSMEREIWDPVQRFSLRSVGDI